MLAFPRSLTLLVGATTLAIACARGKSVVPKGQTAVEFRAKVTDAGGPLVARPGATVLRAVTVRNLSSTPFPADGRVETPRAVNVAYHLLDSTGNAVVFDGARTPLPSTLEPGEAVEVDLRVVAPGEPGAYVLEVDLVQEGVAWFGARGSETTRVPVKVE